MATRGWVIAAMALLLTLPAAVTTVVVAANPRHVPVAAVGQPHEWILWDPYAMTVLDSGATAAVDSRQVGVCPDEHCSGAYDVIMPCVDGGSPQPDGPGTTSCSSEGQIEAADITPAGTLITLSRDGVTGGQSARLVWCALARNRYSMCEWGGATTLHPMPDVWENWSMSIAATPTGGYAAALLGPGGDDQHGEVLLATCDRLDCPQPTVRGVLTVPLPYGWYGGGLVDLDVDPVSGALALAYFDRGDGSLWLGGCPADCPEGPTLNRAYSSGIVPPPEMPLPSIEIAASAGGPAAVLTVRTPDPFVTALACHDLTCTSAGTVGYQPWTSAWPVVDRAGNAYLVGTGMGGNPTILFDVRTGATTRLVGDTRVVAAAFGPDDRLRILVEGPDGDPTLVTCRTAH